MTQCEQVLYHLRKIGPITAREAMTEYGIMRLAARIKDLRDRGHRIRTDMVEVPTRSGDTTDVAEYRLYGQQQLSL